MEKVRKICFSAVKNDFNQQMVCGAHVLWSRYTTICFSFLFGENIKLIKLIQLQTEGKIFSCSITLQTRGGHTFYGEGITSAP